MRVATCICAALISWAFASVFILTASQPAPLWGKIAVELACLALAARAVHEFTEIGR